MHEQRSPLFAIATFAVLILLAVVAATSDAVRFLGTAHAQEAPAVGAGTLAAPLPADAPPERSTLSVPSEADRAALRYFAREGEVDRLDAELRRLRALYPDWQPPSDLLDPEGEDRELERVYELVGEQRYDEARAAIAERRQRDPTYEPPARLVDLLALADARQRLREASEANDARLVLEIAEANERILTCEDVDSVWRVAEAFAETGRPQRAYDAYAYVINSCTGRQAERAASLQKASATLDPSYVTELFALGESDADGINEFNNARLDIIRGAVSRAGDARGVAVPAEWLQLLADHARSGERLDDAMTVGFYLYRRGAPVDAAEWFRFALDNGFGARAAEAYIIALRATDDRSAEALARQVAYEWRDQTPELMETYLSAMATILTADELGQTSVADVDQLSVNRFVPVVIEQRDANGAQALGWYAFNTCQFIIAEEWFISSANWVPTEAALYGLALARLRIGDRAGFREVVDEWGALYPSVRALATGGRLNPADPVTGDRDDPTEELGLGEVICDPKERERLRRLVAERQAALAPGAADRRDPRDQDPLTFTAAGSLSAARPGADEVTQPPSGKPQHFVVMIPRDLMGTEPQPMGEASQRSPRRQAAGGERPDVLLLAQGAVPILPRPEPTAPLPSPRQGSQPPEPIVRGRSQVLNPSSSPPADSTTVTRRVRGGLPDASARQEAADVRAIIAGERSRRSRRSTGGGGTSAQRALASRDFSRCVAITNGAIRNGTLSAVDAGARGFCLLELERPIEAAQAFQLAKRRARSGSSAQADALYGATLAAIALNLTQEAALAAADGPMSRARRTETQIEILTQRAIAANRADQPVAVIQYLHQRNRIAPLQKDLMLLEGFAHQNAGRLRAAERLFRAVDGTGATTQSRQAVFAAYQRRYPLRE